AGSLEHELIELIKTTISPTIWTDAGGPASLEYFPLTHSLVAHAPPDVQEQIAELFEAMRRWLDLEVSCELRFVTMSDPCYDRLKSEFALKDCKDAPMACLNDKQLGKLMEAAQTDPRSQVMQAPKVTMFDGQFVTIRIGEERFFVTAISLRWDGEKLVCVPQNERAALGFQIGLEPHVSADHRQVELSLSGFVNRLEGEKVPLVPVVALQERDRATGQVEGSIQLCGSGQPPKLTCEAIAKIKEKGGVALTQFIQTPRIAKVCLEHKLVLPEGKTAVLYGWKQTTEVTEAVPVLSDLPVIGKFYRKVRKEPETVLVLVTPRVVIPQASEPEALLPAKVVRKKKPVKHAGDGEESEEPAGLAELLAKYQVACAEGKFELAHKIALRALKLDPTCFANKP
ncbi:MAG TPA: hypothetical protein VKE94_19335, partial [Gemmataceae bacterium]|nr:hypothetical protein [Gemmataceae bacterium]